MKCKTNLMASQNSCLRIFVCGSIKFHFVGARIKWCEW